MSENLSHLPVNTQPRHKRFGGEVYVKADPAKGRLHSQTERTCVCGVVKITVHGVPADLARMWRLPGSTEQFGNEMGAPPCSSNGAGA